MISEIEFRLCVQNEMVSAEFYSFALNKTAKLDVPGMTEFELSNKLV
ncbi:hypothetical protein N9F27_01550 [Crocinitomicaceae bacterium]|nr:hypothetical protein [Crocinitomicaceae bacterium]